MRKSIIAGLILGVGLVAFGRPARAFLNGHAGQTRTEVAGALTQSTQSIKYC